MTDERFDLILTGLQSDDQGFAQVGVILAERLDLPHATIIMEVQIGQGGVQVKRELEGGWFQWVAMPLPAVLTIQSGINQLRYGTLNRATWETIAAAQQLSVASGTPVSVLVLGADTSAAAQEIAAARVQEVVALTDAALEPYTPDGFTAALQQAIPQLSATYVL